MKKILTLTALLFSVLSLSARGNNPIKGAAFVEIRTPAGVDGSTVELGGVLDYTPDNFLSMKYDNGDYFIIDGKTMTIMRDCRKNVFDLEKNMMMRSLSHALLYNFQGKSDLLAKEQGADIATEDNGKGVVTVTLTARKRSARGYGMIVVTYDSKSGNITSMRMDEFTGASTYYKIK